MAKKNNIFKEFSSFVQRGNAIDMAVGIIIGAAFGKIVDSLVKDVLMPPIGLLLGKVDFSDLKFFSFLVFFNKFVYILVKTYQPLGSLPQKAESQWFRY